MATFVLQNLVKMLSAIIFSLLFEYGNSYASLKLTVSDMFDSNSLVEINLITKLIRKIAQYNQTS